MRFTIYGIRLIGQSEIRYVGRTAKSLAHRLYGHKFGGGALAAWIDVNRDAIEIIPLAQVTEWGSAKATEREMIRVCLAMGHRLFNQWLVPAEMRCANRNDRAAA